MQQQTPSHVAHGRGKLMSLWANIEALPPDVTTGLTHRSTVAIEPKVEVTPTKLAQSIDQFESHPIWMARQGARIAAIRELFGQSS